MDLSTLARGRFIGEDAVTDNDDRYAFLSDYDDEPEDFDEAMKRQREIRALLAEARRSKPSSQE